METVVLQSRVAQGHSHSLFYIQRSQIDFKVVLVSRTSKRSD
nr:MAG TPA: hypothetical protein [Caudoviricetes sp.]